VSPAGRDAAARTSEQRRPAPLLEWSLFFTFACHGVAMIGMVLFLLPGMPGGGVADDAARVAYVADHPWLWRLGWLPWQITAVSDLLLAIALYRTPWIPRAPAIAVCALTLGAVGPDQLAQALWVTEGVDLARAAVEAGDVAPYLAFEARIFPLTAAWAATLYTLAAIGWSVAFARARVWSRALTRLSIAAWTVFIVVSAAPLLPSAARVPSEVVAAGNATGFLLLQLWLVLVSDEVMKVSRRETAHGRLAPWRHPRAGLVAGLTEWIANSRFLRALCERLPVLSFASDITDVVYVNYLVPAERLEPLVPEGLELQRLGPEGRYALFTFLTYRHGHFGPRRAGPLRRLLPSPIQSNWRVYVRHRATGHEGIYFTTTAISTPYHAIAARLMAEGLPMHALERAELRRAEDGTISLALEPGPGSAPDARATLRPSERPELEPPWSECFGSYHELLAYDVPQDRAMSTQPWRARMTRQEIALGIPLEACEPLEGEVDSRAARAIVGDASPLCFRVAKVGFVFEAEHSHPV
jgi:hypothetical protein